MCALAIGLALGMQTLGEFVDGTGRLAEARCLSSCLRTLRRDVAAMAPGPLEVTRVRNAKGRSTTFHVDGPTRRVIATESTIGGDDGTTIRLVQWPSSGGALETISYTFRPALGTLERCVGSEDPVVFPLASLSDLKVSMFARLQGETAAQPVSSTTGAVSQLFLRLVYRTSDGKEFETRVFPKHVNRALWAHWWEQEEQD